MLVLYIILDKRAATVWGSELKAGALKVISAAFCSPGLKRHLVLA